MTITSNRRVLAVLACQGFALLAACAVGWPLESGFDLPNTLIPPPPWRALSAIGAGVVSIGVLWWRRAGRDVPLFMPSESAWLAVVADPTTRNATGPMH